MARTVIYPSSLGGFVEASGDTVGLWLPDNSMFAGQFLVEQPEPADVYSSFGAAEIEPFTHLFCSKTQSLCRHRWKLCVRHGQSGFLEWGLLGVASMIKEHEGDVEVLLAPEDDHLLGYYTKRFEAAGVNVRMAVPCAPARAEALDLPQLNNQPVVAGKAPKVQEVTTDIGAAQAKMLLARPVFELRSGRLCENACDKPYWFPWEAGEPYARWQASFAGLPFYCNPNIFLCLAQMVDHAKPDVIVEFEPFKYGLTSALALFGQAVGATTVAVVPSGRANDSPWFEALTSRAWAAKVHRVEADFGKAPTGDEPVSWGGPWHCGVAVINVHAQPSLGYAWRMATACMDHGFVVLHGDAHLDVPAFVASLKNEACVTPVEWLYNPEGGAWITKGTFWWQRLPK